MISEKILLPCGVEVKNRFLKSAMTEGLADANAEARDLVHRLMKKADLQEDEYEILEYETYDYNRVEID